jgi:hypothetical protein
MLKNKFKKFFESPIESIVVFLTFILAAGIIGIFFIFFINLFISLFSPSIGDFIDDFIDDIISKNNIIHNIIRNISVFYLYLSVLTLPYMSKKIEVERKYNSKFGRIITSFYFLGCVFGLGLFFLPAFEKALFFIPDENIKNSLSGMSATFISVFLVGLIAYLIEKKYQSQDNEKNEK